MRTVLTRAWDAADRVVAWAVLAPPLAIYGAWWEPGEWLRRQQGRTD